MVIEKTLNVKYLLSLEMKNVKPIKCSVNHHFFSECGVNQGKRSIFDGLCTIIMSTEQSFFFFILKIEMNKKYKEAYIDQASYRILFP